jgi:NadR type nicotinamide-nucleotide adenylyltransferase
LAPFPRICLIGAESTGKSELARALARHFSVTVVPEFAREYALRVARPLDASDVEPIARGQIANEDGAPRDALRDTDLLSTVVYARYYYGSCPAGIEDEARRRLADLYLWMDIDVPWEADPARDSAADRAKLHQMFGQALQEFGARYELISGDWEEREALAIAVIEEQV